MSSAVQGALRAAVRCGAPQPRRSLRAKCAAPQSGAASPARLAVRLQAFNANDPATWGGSSVEEPELQTLSDADLFALLNAPAADSGLPPAPAPRTKARAPEDAASAVALGLSLFRAEPRAALEQFVSALDMPGSGPRRTKGKPAELSTGELQAALFNAACCHAQLGEPGEGMAALRAAVDAGFDDWAALRQDADLAPLRQSAEWPPFAASLPAPKPPPSFLGGLFGR
jgi:hypothetical protein